MNSTFDGLDVKRAEWLQERAKNQWGGEEEEPIESPSLIKNLFGNFGKKK
jgi:hypothetical protein